MILPDCDLVGALTRADTLRALISEHPINLSQASAKITISMGVAVSTDHATGDINSLLNQADRGLYAAKQNGRNRVENIELAATNTAVSGMLSKSNGRTT
jgi:diguanylate cyclase (GGDEF)-like protein